MKRSHRDPARIDRTLAALRIAADNAQGRLGPGAEDALADLLAHSDQRLGFGAGFTVVALAGATGGGKSSLFNALSGSELAEVGVRRPTTASARACVWGPNDAGALLDWLRIGHRHRAVDEQLEGLVLLDLPDHDSTETSHRLEADRLIGLVDLFVWVVDPQKYADAALHESYLRPLSTHAPVTLVALNQTDRLSPEEARRCVDDMARLVEADGMKGVRIISTSARTGEGIDELRAVVAERVHERRVAIERIEADADRLAQDLAVYCGDGRVSAVEGSERRALTGALARAAGVEFVTRAVSRSHRRDAALAMGWPVTRWLRKLRPDPLGRLHLGRSGGGRTSLPTPGAIERALVESSIRELTHRRTDELPQPWPVVVQRRAAGSVDELLEDLDTAIAQTPLGADDRPAWWSVAGGLQALLLVASIVGFLWLMILFGLEWLKLPEPPTPEVADRLPVPTLLLAGGLLAGFLLGALCGVFARIGAARRERRAYKRVVTQVGEVAEERVIAPIEEELRAYRDFCAALADIRR